ncbi:MAG TPA: TldD/PmbA family protein [Bacillota bacterium]|nr:TldD/PmbA family protein [Bacillota bacterium]
MNSELLASQLSTKGYQDIRYQTLDNLTISVKGQGLGDVITTRKQGGHARSLTGGGFGTYSFTGAGDLGLAVRQSMVLSNLIPGRVTLANVPVEQEKIGFRRPDPRTIPMEEKKELLLKYHQQLMAHPAIISTGGTYFEIVSNKHYVNNEGTAIEQSEVVSGMRFNITAKGNGITQITRLSLGGGDDFADLGGQEEAVEARAQQTEDLLSAETISEGNYDVILDHEVGGLFIHEAFGHLSEADNLLQSQALQKTMTLGTEFGLPWLNVVDDPGEEGHPGSYVFDDEGVRGSRTHLIREGMLAGRLHSRQTAGLMGETPTGHCRAKDFSFRPIPRMGNIFIAAGPHSFDDMVASIDRGLYLFGAAGGQTSGERFSFAVQGGYRITGGRIVGMVRDVSLGGNLFTTLRNISMVGSEFVWSRAGGCGKQGQSLVNCGKGSVPVKIDNMAIGVR